MPTPARLAHQEREVGSRDQEKVRLADILPTSEGSASSPAAIEDMLEASFHELASLSSGSHHGLRGLQRGLVLLAQPVRPALPLGALIAVSMPTP